MQDKVGRTVVVGRVTETLVAGSVSELVQASVKSNKDIGSVGQLALIDARTVGNLGRLPISVQGS